MSFQLHILVLKREVRRKKRNAVCVTLHMKGATQLLISLMLWQQRYFLLITLLSAVYELPWKQVYLGALK